ncbi:unnamed protein product [Adineta ricciae]|uniref:Leucine-rich repeat and IQ domain-containing protein 1 n=1 Tax=Adineta ricciae TaxID=249248 RepID=A0A814AAK8_ADIRI|nr:unnamed protein product [Adineta ricciae]
MDPNDETDLDRLIQEELDALTLDGSLEDDEDQTEQQTDTKPVEFKQDLNETRRNLEKEMHERLAAFQKESEANVDRYDIDFTEIDELIKRPVGQSEKEIQNNVAHQCGIEREELDRILESINTEELPSDSMIQSNSDDDDDDKYDARQKIEALKRSLQPVETVETAEPTPREQEDPNKKLYDERLIESHQRMLDELALLEQRRKEEEERYAVVLQEQQIRLTEEYRRLQETLDENTRQAQNEKLQFENLCREQERVTNERHNKMATIIQAWYRGRRVYRQYHKEIEKRVEPTLKSIAKKRKKREQIEMANVPKATKTQRIDPTEKENQRETTDMTTILLPTSNRISSPLIDVAIKPINQGQKLQPLIPTEQPIAQKEESAKKKKVNTKQTSNTPPPSTQILQLENPIDFIPTVFPDETNIVLPNHRVSSPIQSKQQRVRSPHRRIPASKVEPAQVSVNAKDTTSNQKTVPTSKQLTMIPIKASNTHMPTHVKDSLTTLARSNTFDKNIESPITPSIENISLSNSLIRSKTFDKEMENFQRPTIERISTARSVDSTSSATLKRSNTFVNKSSTTLLRIGSISPRKAANIVPPVAEIKPDPIVSKPTRIPSPTEHRTQIETLPAKEEKKSEVSINNSQLVFSFHDPHPIGKSADPLPVDPIISSKPIETVPVTRDRPITPKVSTPRKTVPVQERPTTQVTYPFLNDARRWAEHTRDMTYANLIQLTEELSHQIPSRKTGVSIRKLPDIDSQLLTKAAKSQSPSELRYLLLDKLITPCSLSLVGNTYSNLTHLTLRQCKLVQLTGLESCSSLTILDVENNWLEQMHIQLNHLQYLNISRNRLTSLLSLQSPSLKYLDVSKNRLTRLNGIETLSNLNILLATGNQLLTTIGLQGCTHLLHMDLSDNHLVEMEQLEQCPLLITLKATSNALIQCPNLLNSILLNELDLSSNSLTSFDELSTGSWLPFLTHLRLASNSLQELSPIKLPVLNELDLGFNQLSDESIVKRFVKTCPSLCRLNLEQNPVLCDINETLVSEKKSPTNPITLLPNFSTNKSTESIQLYLTFLSNITSVLIKLRQTVEQCQTEPFHLLKLIQNQCQQYYEQKKVEPVELSEIIKLSSEPKELSPKEQSIIRLQAHWRRRLMEQNLDKCQQAAQKIQARWRGYVVRQRMYNVRHFHSSQQQTFDEIDLTQFEFDEAAFDAKFQRPQTPVARVRQVWQSQHGILPSPIQITELSRPNSGRASSTASSRAKPIVEPLDMSARPIMMTNEWGFTPSSTTAALMLKRAQKMKWNAERRQKRQHMDAFQRLQMARNNEQPPGTLRLARRKPSVTNTTKPLAHTQTANPPVVTQPRANRVYEWVHTQVARIDDSGLPNANSPRYDRKRLPSLESSTDSLNRLRSNELLHQQQNRWNTSSVSIRQPPSLLPPINGQNPRL